MPSFSDRTIEKFKTQLKGGGARSNLFEVSFGTEQNSVQASTTDGTASNIFSTLGVENLISVEDLMLIKTAGLPASTISEIPVPFRGRTLKIAGDRTFDVWSITVINDTDFKWRTFFERWMNYIVKVSDGSGTTDPGSYMVDMNVAQLSRQAADRLNQKGSAGGDIGILRKYVVHSVFPTNVSQIELSYNNENEIEEFTVDLQVQWWESYDGNNVGQVI
jgi:hypothetical protein